MCGVVAIVGPDAGRHASEALLGLQHRGADAAGLAVAWGEQVHTRRGLGRIAEVLTEPADPRARLALAHTRYRTSGGRSEGDAQPVASGCVLALGFNGHLPAERDAELLARVLADALAEVGKVAEVPEAVRSLRITGAYAAVALVRVAGELLMIGFTDQQGIRPLWLGERAGLPALASESAVLDLAQPLGAGSVVVIGEGGTFVDLGVQGSPCAMERVYFARADSRWGDLRMAAWRSQLGAALAKELTVQVDAVVPVPHTAMDAASAVARELGVPCVHGFAEGPRDRSFLAPPDERSAVARAKLWPVSEVFRGQRVLLVDDTIVRGTTMHALLPAVMATHPAELHVAIAAPPVVAGCIRGLDLASDSELLFPAVDSLVERFGLASLTYLPVAALRRALGGRGCDACFSREEPNDVTNDRSARGYHTGGSASWASTGNSALRYSVADES